MKIRSVINLSLGLLVPISTWAAPTVVAGRASGRSISIPLTAAMANSKILVHVTAPSKDAQTLNLTVSGPGGLKVSVKSVAVSAGQNAYQALNKDALGVSLFTTAGARQELRISHAQTNGAQTLAAGDGDPLCGCLTEEQIARILAAYAGLFDRATLCAGLSITNNCSASSGGGGGGVNPGGTGGDANAVSGSAFLTYNRCLGGTKPGAVIQLDLADVDAASLTGSITVTSTISAYRASRKVSIKPASDGKLGAQPIMLSAPVYGTNSNITLRRYSGKRLTSQKLVSIYDSITYRGGSYWRSPLGGLMRGGKGVFEMRAGSAGYSICASLTATRQRFNGYTN